MIFILVPTVDEMRHMALKEIFYFYSRQHQYMRKELKGTFDSIRDKHEHLDLGEFMKFCIEFKIMVKKEALMESFKKTAENTRELTFDKFIVILTSVASKMNEDKIKMLQKRLKKSKADLTVLYEKNMNKMNNSKIFENSSDSVEEVKESILEGVIDKSNTNLIEVQPPLDKPTDKPIIPNKVEVNNLIQATKPAVGQLPVKPTQRFSLDKYKKAYTPISLIELEKEVEQTENSIKELRSKNLDILLEELYHYMGLDNESSYRKRMKGFLLPFSSENKQFRIPQEVLMKKVKKLDPRTAEDIKRIIADRKEEKQRDKEEKERLQKLMVFEQRKKLNKLNRNIVKQSEDNSGKNYAKLAHQHENFEKEKESKITWDQLENLKFDHFITNRDDDFNPKELIDFDYDSDDDDIFGRNKDEKANNKRDSKIYNYNNVAILNEKLNDSRTYDKHHSREKKTHSDSRIDNARRSITQADMKQLNESAGSKRLTNERSVGGFKQAQNSPIRVISNTRIIPDIKKPSNRIKNTEMRAKEADQARLEHAIKV
jgi:hypothetical protein